MIVWFEHNYFYFLVHKMKSEMPVPVDILIEAI